MYLAISLIMFLKPKKAEKSGDVVTVSYDLPKSFVVVNKKKSKEKTVYITQISSTTLNKRNISKNIYL